MTTNYQKGAVFERQVKKKLEAVGWFVVRMAGSHSPVDLVAVKRLLDYPHVAFIQCKTDGQLGPAEWNELLELARHVGAWAYLAHQVKHKFQIHQLMGMKISRVRPPMLEATWMLKTSTLAASTAGSASDGRPA